MSGCLEAIQQPRLGQLKGAGADGHGDVRLVLRGPQPVVERVIAPKRRHNDQVGIGRVVEGVAGMIRMPPLAVMGSVVAATVCSLKGMW